LALFETIHKLHPAPGIINRSHFNVHQPSLKPHSPHDTVVKIGFYPRTFLGPADPKQAIQGQRSLKARKFSLEFGATVGKEVDEVTFGPQLLLSVKGRIKTDLLEILGGSI
jgi:hypothetical protein